MNGVEWKLWDKSNINIVTFCKADMRMRTIMSTLIRLSLNCLIRKKSFLERNFLPLLKFISLNDPKILHSKVFNTWLLNASKNVNLSKERNSFPIFNLLVAGLASPQLLIVYRENWLNLISMVMDQRWRSLLQTKGQKEEFQVGWEQQLWPQWESSINGLSARRNTKSMERFKLKKGSDWFCFKLCFIWY